MTELHRNLAANMKRRRAFLSLSQAELAERAEISPGYIGEVETGRKFPSAETLERLARILQVRPFRLLMSEADLAEAGGSDSIYDAASHLRDRVVAGLDDAVRELLPDWARDRPERGRAPKGRPGRLLDPKKGERDE